MKCPLCSVDLVMTDRHGVEIDYCPKCRGVWLDRGELDKIIGKATGPNGQHEPAPQPRVWQEPYREQPTARRDDDHYRRSDNDRDSYKRHKRKSFLAEIFDFG